MGSWDSITGEQNLDEATENSTTEGKSPVVEKLLFPSWIPSSTGHVESRVNQRGPSRKAKYYCVTDSETVPRGKGEKNPARGVK